MADEEGLWEKGAFVESIAPGESEEKMKTFHKRHDEDMNYICRKCGNKISAHNRDWHDSMCDECFNGENFSEGSSEREGFAEEVDKALDDFDPDKHSVLELCKESGTGISVINDADTEAFMPLLMVIEETIWSHCSESGSLKDTDIIGMLKNVRNNIFSDDAEFNKIEADIIDRIKIVLRLNNYDRRDVSLSISKVLKSAKLHRSIGGNRGYLKFLSDFFEEEY